MASTTRTARALCVATLACAASASHADHALLQDGRVLFNVHVENTNTTESRKLRVRSKPASFGYDFDSGNVFPLRVRSQFYGLADFITTSVEVKGKADGRKLMREQQWHKYVQPSKPILKAPTPAPTPTPQIIVVATPLPINIAPTYLPLEERIQLQLDIFVREQEALSRDLQTSTSAGFISEIDSRKRREKWLEAQRQVLDQFYPAAEQSVKNAKAQWDEQLEVVRSKGLFRFELQQF